MNTLIEIFLNIFFKAYSYFLLKTKNKIFCFFANLRFLFLFKKARFSYKNEIYSIEDESYSLKFYHRKQAILSYRYGIKKRIDLLSKAYFLDKINFKENDLIIDCGANVGDLYLYFKKNNLKINYIGIEPSPLEFKCLYNNVSNYKLNNVKFHNIGLWDSNSNLKFYLASEKADSSFIEPKKYDDIILVDSKRLDTLIKKPIKLLKLEAEGAEIEAIKGCENLLNKIEYISADLGPERGKKEEYTLESVINYLLENNFELLKISHKRIIALFKNKNFEN